ncbi:MAG: sensor domain-containing diguanylate cyclase [Desulfomicrobium apsheronum]|nr:sensor domain-containing diguanylate cyclase [Desulfomicrobium apsheronum]
MNTVYKKNNENTLEKLLKDQNYLWNILFEQARDGIVVLNQSGKVVISNKKFEEMLGYSSRDLQNMHVWDWDNTFSKNELLCKIKKIDYLGHHFETTHIRKNGTLIDVELSNSATIFENNKIIFCICRDITQRKINEKHIHTLATIDCLTGLYNRREFISQVERQISSTKKYKDKFSLIMYDIDDFKFINDNFGHLEGDKVLTLSSKLILKNIRNNDIAARWGGEEFMLLLPHSNISNSRIIAEKLRHLISGNIFNLDISITASFGVTEFLHSDDIEILLKRVDKALYQAKMNGKNRVEFLT